jgi:hypothetical protein
METGIQSERVDADDGVLLRMRRQFDTEVSHHCPECAYLELRVPDDVGEIQRVTFTTLSHDQGTFLTCSNTPGANMSQGGPTRLQATHGSMHSFSQQRVIHRENTTVGIQR